MFVMGGGERVERVSGGGGMKRFVRWVYDNVLRGYGRVFRGC